MATTLKPETPAPKPSDDVEVECTIKCFPPAIVQGLGEFKFGERRRIPRSIAASLGEGFLIHE